MTTRWQRSTAPRGEDYDQRWSQMAEAGENVHGEADLVAELLTQFGGNRVLDAGCGTGRIAIELTRRGIETVGVDADQDMLTTARRKAPEIDWLTADLAELDEHLNQSFDVVLLAGNVMIFLRPGTEAQVVSKCAARMRPGGLLLAGFQVSPDRLPLASYDDHAAAAGLTLIARWSTWDRQAYDEGGEYAVSLHQLPDPQLPGPQPAEHGTST